MRAISHDKKKEDGQIKSRSGLIPRDRKRYRGRLIRRWNDEIKSEVGPLWRRSAENRRKWQASGEAYALKRAGTRGKDSHRTTPDELKCRYLCCK